jgi:hypothetical protein
MHPNSYPADGAARKGFGLGLELGLAAAPASFAL